MSSTTPARPQPEDAEEDLRVDGRDTRWEAHRSSRRAELVSCARRAVHHLGPELSMDELATEMGTSKSIIYRYFTDKSGLQAAVGSAVLEDLRQAIADATAGRTRPRDQIAAMVEVYLGEVETSFHVYAFVTRPEATAGALRGFIAETEDLVADLLLPVLRSGNDSDDGDRALVALWASGMVGMARASAERWLAARGSRPATETPEVTTDEDTEDLVAALDRAELAAWITDWLWEGAIGVARRVRNGRERHPSPAPSSRPATGRRNRSEHSA